VSKKNQKGINKIAKSAKVTYAGGRRTLVLIIIAKDVIERKVLNVNNII
jgi:hypothetical protein